MAYLTNFGTIMKRFLIAVLLLTSTNAAIADDRWVAPALVGGLMGYIAGTNQQIYSFQPPPVYTPPPVIYYESLPEQHPVYEKQFVFDETCYCTRRMFVRIQ